MTTAIVLVTHGAIGEALRDEAQIILGRPLGEIRLVGMPQSSAGAVDRQQINNLIAEADQGEGVLVLSDLAGATPCNCAIGAEGGNCRIVSGVNLPMLLRVINYADKPLDELTDIAVSGGRRGIAGLTR